MGFINAVLDQLFDAVKPAGVIVNVSIWGTPATIDLQRLGGSHAGYTMRDSGDRRVGCGPRRPLNGRWPITRSARLARDVFL